MGGIAGTSVAVYWGSLSSSVKAALGLRITQRTGHNKMFSHIHFVSVFLIVSFQFFRVGDYGGKGGKTNVDFRYYWFFIFIIYFIKTRRTGMCMLCLHDIHIGQSFKLFCRGHMTLSLPILFFNSRTGTTKKNDSITFLIL